MKLFIIINFIFSSSVMQSLFDLDKLFELKVTFFEHISPVTWIWFSKISILSSPLEPFLH